MTKRIFAMLLAVAMALSMAPMVALAQEQVTASPKAGSHTADGHSDDCGMTDGWQPWEKADSLPTGGKYYLTSNVTVSGELYLMQDLTLCLNGFVVNTSNPGKRLISTQAGQGITLTICDCTAYTENDVYYAGALTGGKDSSTLGGGAILVRYGSAAKLYDGRITGNTSATCGGAVTLQAASGSQKAEFFMYGGEISDNTAISGTKYKTGGALYLGDEGVFTMTGGTIKGNTGSGGGVLYAVDDAAVSIENAIITGNTASYTGAVFHCAKGTLLTIKDSRLTGNTCTSASGGGVIRMDGAKGRVTVSGSTVIADNNLPATQGDIMLMSTYNDSLQVKELAAGSNVRFCTPATEPATAGEVMTVVDSQSDWGSGWVTYIAKDGAGRRIGFDGTEFSFLKGHRHDTAEFLPWEKEDALPDSGCYYLTKDVTLQGQTTVSDSLELCLNGHTVQGYRGRAFDVTGTLKLCNCGSEAVFTGFSNNDHGGVIRSSGSVYAENITFRGNTTTSYGGVLLSTAGDVTFKNCKLEENRAAQGGALSIGGTGVLENCSFTGNYADNAGALRAAGSKTILVDRCCFTGNAAKVVGAITVTSNNVELTLKDTTVTGNSTTGGYGAVNLIGSAKPIKLVGKVIVTGNTMGDQPQNLHVQSGVTDGYDITGLTNGSQLGITLQPSRIAAGKLTFTTADETNNKTYFISDDAIYEIAMDEENKLTLKTPDPISTHKHCICAGENSHCSHEMLEFFDWTDPNALPTEGNWCLTTDVTVSKQFGISKALNLCLNGHTVQVTEEAGRMYYCTGGAKLAITDCTEMPGQIRGATASAILFDAQATGTQLDLWNGSFTDNHIVGGGAAVVIQGETVFNMYGGTFSGNWAESAMKKDASGDPVLDAEGNPTCYSSNGGALFAGAGTTFNFYDGIFTENKVTHVEYYKKAATKVTKSGGNGGALAIYGTANLYGGKIVNNEAFLGGGAFVSGSQGVLNLLGTEISGNKATSGGGVINQSRSVVNFSAGTVSDNAASLSGGGMYVSINSRLNVTGGTVSGNRAENNGGGIYLQKAEAIITDGTFSGNSTKNLGGAIYLTGKGAVLTIKNALITENSATSGAGVFAYDETVFTLDGGKITNNAANSAGGGVSVFAGSAFTMNGGSISGNTSKNDGGGLYLLRATTNFNGGSVSSNAGANGGGIKIAGGKHTFRGTTISGNLARGKMAISSTTGLPVKVEGNGGGIHVSQAGYKVNGVEYQDKPVVTVHSFYVANNKATSAGGGVLVQSQGAQFTMYGGTISGNDATAGGGGIYFSTGTTNKVLSGTISNNTSLKAGGVFILNCTADLSNITVTGNHAGSIGGAFVMMGNTTVVNMKNMEIRDNISDATGGVAVIQNYAVLNMEDCTVIGNAAKTTGGLYFSNPTYGNLKNVELSENTSNTAGGALYVSKNCPVVLENCTLRANSSENSGGAAYTKGRIELNNCKVLDNISGKNGGAVGSGPSASAFLSDNAGIRASNTIFSGNQAAELGGAVYNHRGCPTELTGCTFTDNTAAKEGSAIYADGRFGLTDASITGNKSENGGSALYVTSSNYDGHSYTSGYKYLAGKIQIQDNQGGDLYLCENAIVAITGESLTQGSQIQVRLQTGVLTQQLLGVYDYEGGDLVYTVTPGDRSITDPEHYAESNDPAQTDQSSNNTVLYIAIAGIAVLAAGAIALIAFKKKKATKAAKA